MHKKPYTNPREWAKFLHLFKRKEVPARTILLNEGEISKAMFFIETGCLRTFFDNNGTDITTQFFFEGDSVSSFESFRTKQPSLYSIESLEPSTLLSISQKDFQSIIDASPVIKKEMEEHLFRRLIHCQQFCVSHLKYNPKERYEELLRHQPRIIQRVPQHYIASYLGITPVSLSRIRNRR